MKRYRLIYMMAAVVCLATACQDEVITDGTVTLPAEVGEDILFGARAGFENANPSSTRTAYNGTYTVGTGAEAKTYERIIWTDKDQIQIYSPQAHNPADGLTGDNVHSAHYTVVRNDDAATENNDEAYLERTEETSLQWGQGDGEAGTHDFYAMYPSPFLFQNADGTFPFDLECAEAISMNGTNIGGYIHTEQITTVTYANNKYTASPDMRYAYMVAKTTTTREEAYTEDADGNVKGVSLTFFPIVTAMELELSLPSTSGTEAKVNPVTIAKVVVSGTDIAGSFTSDISGADCWEVDANGKTTAFKGNITTGSIKADEIAIWTSYGDADHPLTLEPGQSLTFTVFMKPNADLQNIKVGIVSDLVGQDVKYKTLGDSNSPVTIVARKKNVFTGLKLPVATTNVGIDYSNWMEQLPPDTELKGISLPGTGNSFSYGATDTDMQSQTLTFDEQWEIGIRAFEIATNRISGNGADEASLGETTVQCGQRDVQIDRETITVAEVVGQILTKLEENPYETAMLILTYQPNGSVRRNGPLYITQLVNFLEDEMFDNKLVLFEPSLLLGDYAEEDKLSDGKVIEGAVSTGARGKLMILARPDSRDEGDRTLDEGDGGYTPSVRDENVKLQNIRNAIPADSKAAEYLLAVNGCGTSKDKWGARGYKMGGVYAPNISNEYGAGEYIEYYMTTQNSPIFTTYDASTENNTWTNNNGVAITRARKDTPEDLNFGYPTSNEKITCWYQEWARVLPNNLWASGNGSYGSEYSIQWFESYEEKLSNVKTTFDMAVSGKYVEQGYVFINSLCGYLADSGESIVPSIGYTYGGASGNISALSTKLNQDFYQYVNSKRKEMVAPTGIVLMDFVSNDPENGGGAYWLPQLIIANNEFKVGVGDDDNTGGDGGDDNKEPDENETPEDGGEG